MTERISIVALRSEAEETIGVRKILAADAGQPPAVLEAEELLALVEAVEALRYIRADLRLPERLRRLANEALARFDFGGMT